MWMKKRIKIFNKKKENIMKYILIALTMLFFIGCSPKYRAVNEYIAPVSETGKVQLNDCQKTFSTCKEICKANFDICKVKAEKAAHESYDKKMIRYQAMLEQYANDMEMYELELDLMYFDGFGLGYGYGGFGYGYGRYGYSPFGGMMMGPRPLFRPHKPRKPSLEAEIREAEMSICQIDCGCTKSYDNCFLSVGGKINTKQVCIENCPSER